MLTDLASDVSSSMLRPSGIVAVMLENVVQKVYGPTRMTAILLSPAGLTDAGPDSLLAM